MATKTLCRRKTSRFTLDGATIEFGYPTPKGHPCSMPLREISPGGLSFELSHELPGIEVGAALRRVRLLVSGRTVRGDVVIMHLTPDSGAGSVCGGLFHPCRDKDIIGLKELLADMGQTTGTTTG